MDAAPLVADPMASFGATRRGRPGRVTRFTGCLPPGSVPARASSPSRCDEHRTTVAPSMPQRLRLAPRGNGAYLLQAMKGDDTIRSDRRLVVARRRRASTQVVEVPKWCRTVHLDAEVFGKRSYVGRLANSLNARSVLRAHAGLRGVVEHARLHRPPEVRTVAPRAPSQGPFAA